jgi:TatA/E family protein of Tat protein translocase
MPFGIQPIHIVIIIVIAFLLFGANKLPELGRSLGKTLSEFRKGTKEATEGFKEEINKPIQDPATAAPATTDQIKSADDPKVSAGNFCIKCGAANLSEARYCASCGTKLPEKLA